MYMKVHDEKETLKRCHFFNNQKVCPFEEIGCKFLHLQSSPCRFTECQNKLCPFTHTEVDDPLTDDEEEAVNEEEAVIDDAEDEAVIGENDCHLCKAKFPNLEPLCEHLRTVHTEYHQGGRSLESMEA